MTNKAELYKALDVCKKDETMCHTNETNYGLWSESVEEDLLRIWDEYLTDIWCDTEPDSVANDTYTHAMMNAANRRPYLRAPWEY